MRVGQQVSTTGREVHYCRRCWYWYSRFLIGREPVARSGKCARCGRDMSETHNRREVRQ